MRRHQRINRRRGGGVHTVPANGCWVNEMGGTVLSRHWTKAEAVTAGRRFAAYAYVEHTIHNRNGVIAEKNSYGNDPHPPKDGRLKQ